MSVIERTARIETRRLTLRAPQIRDIEPIAKLASAADIARMTSRIPHPYRRTDAAAFVARAQAVDPAREAVFVIEKDGCGPLGVIGLESGGRLGPEIGYWVGRPFWGRGVASEATAAVMGWAGREWRRRSAVAGHFADNPASGRVLEKAGFLYTGEVEHRHSLARGQPVATRMMVWLA